MDSKPTHAHDDEVEDESRRWGGRVSLHSAPPPTKKGGQSVQVRAAAPGLTEPGGQRAHCQTRPNPSSFTRTRRLPGTHARHRSAPSNTVPLGQTTAPVRGRSQTARRTNARRRSPTGQPVAADTHTGRPSQYEAPGGGGPTCPGGQRIELTQSAASSGDGICPRGQGTRRRAREHSARP